MRCRLITSEGTSTPENSHIATLLEKGSPFWLDLHGIDESTASLLSDVFKFHPLAIEDAEHFGQRPKVDAYDDYILLVMYGASHDDLAEVHCFYSEHYLVTVHHDECSVIDQLADRIPRKGHAYGSEIMLLHAVLDALVDSFFPMLAKFDDEIDDLEDEILRRPTDRQLATLFQMKRSLIGIRKVVGPARDTMATVLTGVDQLPGMTPDAERYFRDIYDHLIRISDLVDSYRDLMTGALDTHLSTVSTRMNAVMKQLAVIATVFLPLTFLTGFFGQNFGWLVEHITTFPAFIFIGLGLEALAVVGLLTHFWRMGWLHSDETGILKDPTAPPPPRRRGTHLRAGPRNRAPGDHASTEAR